MSIDELVSKNHCLLFDRECLRTIAKARKSSKLEAVADDKSMTTKEAYEFIQASEDVAAEFLEALAAAKVGISHSSCTVKN